MKPNILFLANPQSFTHDYKWILSLSNYVNCYVAPLNNQFNALTNEDISQLKKKNIIVLLPISPFSIVNFYRTLKDLSYLINQVRYLGIQLIHVHYADPSALWALFKRWLKVPMFLTTRGTDILKAIPNVYKKKNLINLLLSVLYKRAFQRFDYISCTSFSQKSVITALFGINDAVNIVRTGVDWDIILHEKKAHFRKELKDRNYWLFPRTMKPVYNHELSLRALKLLPSEVIKDKVLVFVNKDSTDSDYVRKIKRMMGKLTEIEFCFFDLLDQRSMIELIRHAELVINTNLSDGSPVTVMEAMTLRKPILIPPLDYDQQVFSNILQFKEYTPMSLSEGIIEVIDGYYTPQLLDINFNIIYNYCRRGFQMKQIYNQYVDSIKNRKF